MNDIYYRESTKIHCKISRLNIVKNQDNIVQNQGMVRNTSIETIHFQINSKGASITKKDLT